MTLCGLQKAQWSLMYWKQSNEERHRGTGIGEMEEVSAGMGREWSILVLRVDMEAEKNHYSLEEKITDP